MSFSLIPTSMSWSIGIGVHTWGFCSCPRCLRTILFLFLLRLLSGLDMLLLVLIAFPLICLIFNLALLMMTTQIWIRLIFSLLCYSFLDVPPSYGLASTVTLTLGSKSISPKTPPTLAPSIHQPNNFGRRRLKGCSVGFGGRSTP
jgi:hypothetical protein